MEWISVKDQLPDLNSWVLSTDGKCVAFTHFLYNDYSEENYWQYFTSGCGCCDTDMPDVSHWMPLPKLPKE